jgi:hypothetical protein
MRLRLKVLLSLSFVCASCHSPLPTTRPTEAIIPTTEPSRPNSADRLTALSPQLNDCWKAYISREGDAHRSDFFSQVSLELWSVHLRNPAVVINEREVLSFLGLPDCGTRIQNEVGYVYFYARTDTRTRWAVFVMVKNGQLDEMGWNDASVNDTSHWKHYCKWSDVLGPAK